MLEGRQEVEKEVEKVTEKCSYRQKDKKQTCKTEM